MRRILSATLVSFALATTLQADECRRMEAEDFSRIDGSMELIHDQTSGGDGTVVGTPEHSDPLGNDHVRYVFRPRVDGEYYFRSLAFAPTGHSDSFCVRIEHSATGSVVSPSYAGQCGGDTYWDFWANPNWQLANLTNGWNTGQLVKVSLAGGEDYTFLLRRRESGALVAYIDYCRMTPAVAQDAEAEMTLDSGQS